MLCNETFPFLLHLDLRSGSNGWVQAELFQVAGLPMVENCMAGYNSCMFAYGQVTYCAISFLTDFQWFSVAEPVMVMA